jgi:hypothetical protein
LPPNVVDPPLEGKKIISKLSDFPAVIIVDASQFSGGDKPHPYLFGETLFVVAGFIPACKGAECRKNRSI